jgi:hypothetical protein
MVIPNDTQAFSGYAPTQDKDEMIVVVNLESGC